MAEKQKGDGAEQIRKITIKAVYGKVDFERLMKMKPKALDIMDVYGVVTRTKVATSDYGDSVRFVGQFKAINLETGAVYKAGTCFLPKFMEDDLAGALQPGQTAEFGARISAKYDAEAATKYVYLANPIVEAAEMNQFTALEEKMKTARKALPAPSK